MRLLCLLYGSRVGRGLRNGMEWMNCIGDRGWDGMGWDGMADCHFFIFVSFFLENTAVGWW